MNGTQPVPADSESAELLQPADRQLHRPSNGPQVIRFGFPTTRNLGFNPRRGQQGPSGLAVVTFVRRHSQRSFQRTAWNAANAGCHCWLVQQCLQCKQCKMQLNGDLDQLHQARASFQSAEVVNRSSYAIGVIRCLSKSRYSLSIHLRMVDRYSSD